VIKCEGVIKLFQAEAFYHIRFPSKECKKHFENTYCETHDWTKCPYAALLENFYNEDGKIIRRKVSSWTKHTKRDTQGQISFKF
jgi:hypothetical protein